MLTLEETITNIRNQAKTDGLEAIKTALQPLSAYLAEYGDENSFKAIYIVLDETFYFSCDLIFSRSGNIESPNFTEAGFDYSINEHGKIDPFINLFSTQDIEIINAAPSMVDIRTIHSFLYDCFSISDEDYIEITKEGVKLNLWSLNRNQN